MKAMISQPMNGKTDDEIIATREKAIKYLETTGYEVVNTLFTDEWYSSENMKARGVVQIPLCYLAKSLENMSLCHTAYFCKGWENARGCKIEHDAAVAYGLNIIYEEQLISPVRRNKMTIEEASEIIEVAKSEIEWNYPMDYAVAFDIAIEALKKQIPHGDKTDDDEKNAEKH